VGSFAAGARASRDRRLELLDLAVGGELLGQRLRRGDFRRAELAIGNGDAFDLQAQRAGEDLADRRSRGRRARDAW
jgi:hypothetical protein